jgi:hypothetical protein
MGHVIDYDKFRPSHSHDPSAIKIGLAMLPQENRRLAMATAS